MFAVFASVQDQSYNKGVFIIYPVKGEEGGLGKIMSGGRAETLKSFLYNKGVFIIYPVGGAGARQNHEEGQKRLKCFLGRKGLGGSFLFQHS